MSPLAHLSAALVALRAQHKATVANNGVVHKFGGSSLANAERFQRVAGILRQREETQQPRSLLPCSMRASCISGPMSMACSAPTQAWFPKLSH